MAMCGEWRESCPYLDGFVRVWKSPTGQRGHLQERRRACSQYSATVAAFGTTITKISQVVAATGCKHFYYKNLVIAIRIFFSSTLTFAMQFSKVIVPAALASYVAAGNVTVTTDVVVTDFTTYCPESTAFVVNNKTITVTEATTLTITGPCTIPTTYVTASGESSAAPASSTVAAVSTAENGAGKVAAGAIAGVAAVAAALF